LLVTASLPPSHSYGAGRAEEIPAFDETAVAEAAYAALLQAATVEWSARFHTATNVAALGIFEDYFERRPPFSAQESKEFPDAFVVKCLELWCAQNNERMYVVTADKAMIDAIKATQNLLYAKTLEDLFASIAATETPGIRDKVDKLLETRIVGSIQSAMEENIGELIPVYVGDLADGEVTDHELNSDVEIIDFKVVAVSDDDVSLSHPLIFQAWCVCPASTLSSCQSLPC